MFYFLFSWIYFLKTIQYKIVFHDLKRTYYVIMVMNFFFAFILIWIFISHAGTLLCISIHN